MSENDPSKTPATIKIAAKDASKRGASGTRADPGPGDPSAMPSEMPEPVSIPAPPSPSELVIKSGKSMNSRVIKTINDPVSLPKSRGSSASTALKSVRSQKTLSGGAPKNAELDEGGQSGSKSHQSTKSAHGSRSGGQSGPAGSEGTANAHAAEGSEGPREDNVSQPSSGSRGGLASQKSGSSPGRSGGSSAKTGGTSVKSAGASAKSAAPASASKEMQADSQAGGQEQDLVEEGETEIEHPSPSPSPSDASSGKATSSPASGGIDSAPASSGGGTSKASSKTSGHKTKPSETDSVGSAASKKHHHHHHGKKHGKKMSKFRYHKRVTVRTHGKTSPSEVMDKVNKKDHQAGITPSSIGEMDTDELMKRAGIKGGKKAHWRVRLRQTKRTTKDGKTVTQTKVAYRDSEGNKRIKTSDTPFCDKCGKRLEDCTCDE